MVSYLMKKYTDDDITTSNYGGRIRDAHDLAQLALILALRSERDSMQRPFTRVEGERDELKGLVEMTREMTALHRRREDLSKVGGM